MPETANPAPPTGSSWLRSAIGSLRRHHHAPALALLLTVTVASLWLKITPTWAPEAYGEHYAEYASGLDRMDPRIAYNWLAPWLAHHLSARSPMGWLVFLYVCFFVGVLGIYAAVHRQTRDPWFSVAVALLPVASTCAWFGTYLPGYPGWFLLAALALLLFADSLVLWAVLGTLALWAHERAGFALATMPALQSVITGTPLRRVLQQYGVLAAVLLIYVVGRNAFVAIEQPPFTFGFFWKEFAEGSEFAQMPFSIGHALEVWIEGYKAILGVVLLCVVVLGVRVHLDRSSQGVSRHVSTRFLVLFAGACVFITAQLLVAVDSVRLLDFLVFPFAALFVLVHRQLGPKARFLTFALFAAVLVNQLLAVEFIGRHTRFPGL